MSQTSEIEELLRPMAESGDTRFEALRSPQSFTADLQPANWGIDTSLGALVRAAAACGLCIEFLPQTGTDGSMTFVAEADKEHVLVAEAGDTPELAAARALRAWWDAEVKAGVRVIPPHG